MFVEAKVNLQRGLFIFNERVLPQMGYRRRAHMMNSMVPGLAGPKMSSSIKNSKIELLDPPEEVRAKFELASCPTGEVEGNGVLAMLKHILMPMIQFYNENLKGLHDSTPAFTDGANDLNGDHVNGHTNGHTNGARAKTNLGSIKPWTFSLTELNPPKSYISYEEIETDFLTGELTPQTLKASAAKATNELLQPLREMYLADKDWQEVDRLAYGSIQLQ